MAIPDSEVPSLEEMQAAVKVIDWWSRKIAVPGGIWLVKDLLEGIDAGLGQIRMELRSQRVDDWRPPQDMREPDPLEGGKESDE